MKLRELETNPVVMVVFREIEGNLIPFQILARPFPLLGIESKHLYDYQVNYSKQYSHFYYALCGSGYDSIDVQKGDKVYVHKKHRDACTNLKEVIQNGDYLSTFPMSQEEWDKLLEDLIEDETYYCSECDDNLPRDSYRYECEHVWHCEECGQFSTPDERCECVIEEEKNEDE